MSKIQRHKSNLQQGQSDLHEDDCVVRKRSSEKRQAVPYADMILRLGDGRHCFDSFANVSTVFLLTGGCSFRVIVGSAHLLFLYNKTKGEGRFDPAMGKSSEKNFFSSWGSGVLHKWLSL